MGQFWAKYTSLSKTRVESDSRQAARRGPAFACTARGWWFAGLQTRASRPTLHSGSDLNTAMVCKQMNTAGFQ